MSADDPFSGVLGRGRGRRLTDADFAESPLAPDARHALEGLLIDIADGRIDEALRLLRCHSQRSLAASISAEHPALGELRAALARQIAAETLSGWRQVTKDFLHLAGVRAYNADCLLVDKRAVLHTWPAGAQHPSIAHAVKELYKSRELALGCLSSAADASMGLAHAPRGAWDDPERFGLARCPGCERRLGQEPVSVTLHAELTEGFDYEPLPEYPEQLNGERAFGHELFATEIEGAMRRMLADELHSRTPRLDFDRAGISAHAEGIYHDELRALTRWLVAANPARSVARALAHPRLLFCDTVRAHAVAPELEKLAAKLPARVAEGLFDGFAPFASTPYSARERLTRPAKAADHVEERICYHSSNAATAFRRRPAEPDIERPAPAPARCHGVCVSEGRFPRGSHDSQ